MSRSVLLNLLLIVCAAAVCKNPDYVQLGNGKCYKLFNTYVNYNDAVTRCAAANGVLASIHNQNDNNVIAQYLASNQWEEGWIGLQCPTANNCQWQDGSAMDFTNYAVNPPSVDHGHCFYIKAGFTNGINNAWLDVDCNHYSDYYLCEEEAQPAKTCGSDTEYNGNCYSIIELEMKFSDAERACQQTGGHLTSILDQAEDAFVFNLLGKSNVEYAAWIGLEYTQPSFTWTDNSPVAYKNIAPTSYDAISCFALSSSPVFFANKWVGEDCQKINIPAVCKRPKSVNPVSTVAPLNPNCGPSQYYGLEGNIRSPSYPNIFQGVSCNYYITGVLKAVNLIIPQIQATQYWALEIYAGTVPIPSEKIASITSQDVPQQYLYSSPTNQMLITFYSVQGNQGQPFTIQYSVTAVPLYPTGGVTVLPSNPPLTTRIPTGNCDPGWTYDDNRNLCYALVSSGNYDASLATCRNYHGDLISVHSSTDQSNLNGILDSIHGQGGYEIWIGLKYSNNQWAWTDGTGANYFDWIDGVSDPSLGNCGATVYDYQSGTHGWKPLDCTLRLAGICVKRPN